MTSAKRVNFFKSIRFRAWVGILLLSIMPLALFGLYSKDTLGDVSRDILIEGSIQAFQQVKYEVDQYVSAFDELTKFLASDKRFSKSEDREAAVEALRHLDKSYESIERIIWVDGAGKLKGHSKKDSDTYKEMSFSETALASSNQHFVFAPEAFLVKAKLSDGPNSDAIITTVSLLKLRKSLEGITFGTNFRYFLVTNSGENILEQPDFPRETIANLMESPSGAYDLIPDSSGGSPQIVISLPILKYGLRIFVFQNAAEVYAVAQKLGTSILNFLWLLVLASFLLAVYLSWTITAPVTLVAHKAIEFSHEEGQKNVTVNIDRDDEVGFLAKSFNNMSQSIARKIKEVSALYRVANYINTSSTSRKALDLCLEYIVELFEAKRGSIMLLNEGGTTLYVESFKLAKASEEGLEDNSKHSTEERDSEESKETNRFELKLGEGIAGEVALTGKAILCMDCSTDERFKNYSDSENSKSPETLISVPLSFQNKMIGVINLSDRSNSQPFVDGDLALLQAIANQMALSIDNARLHNLTVINDKTDLYVRKFLDIRLDDEIKRSKRFGFPLTVVLFSIDSFAELNSKEGNRACDAALYYMGRLLKQTVRATDIPAEYDANKFCAILAHTTSEQAKMFADRFRAIAAEYDIKHDDKTFRITLSAGICQFTKETDDYLTLLSKTDEALSISHKQGNTTTIYEKAEVEEK